MSDGGVYPWKLQKIQQPKNGLVGTCRYADLSAPLPDPPKGQTWVQNESTREWRLVPVTTATIVDSDEGGDVCATAIAVAHPDKSGAEAAGVRYHKVLPTDTFQGICLRYKVTPTELRRANRMMGSNLKLAPNPERLVIPANDKNQALNVGGATKEEKIAALLSRLPMGVRSKLSYSEVRAYLEIADWDVNSALNDVNEDFCS